MNSVADVGPVEARNDHALGRNAKLNKNIFPRMRIRRRGKRQARDTREFVQQGPEHAIIGTEIMAPFADAMRLIDSEHGALRSAEQFAQSCPGSAFGRDIKQVELSCTKPVLHFPQTRFGRSKACSPYS